MKSRTKKIHYALFLIASLIAVFSLSECKLSSSDERDTSQDERDGGENDEKFVFQYLEMYEAVYDYLINEHLCDGCSNWNQDLGDDYTDAGDTTGWGLGYLSHLEKDGEGTADTSFIASRLISRAETLIENFSNQGLGNSLLNEYDMIEIFISIVGLYLAYEVFEEEGIKKAIRSWLNLLLPTAVDPQAELSKDIVIYINLPYGPVTILAGLASAFFQYPIGVGYDEMTAAYIEAGEEIISFLNDRAYDEDRKIYRYWANEDYDFVYTYSNALMAQALIRGYLATNEQSMLERAIEITETLELLYSNTYDSYLAAENDPKYFAFYETLNLPHFIQKYIALSHTNYQNYNNIMLYEITGEQKYLDRTRNNLDFIRDKLFDINQKKINHHLINGTNEEFGFYKYCSGCNFQALYIIYLYNQALQGKPAILPDRE